MKHTTYTRSEKEALLLDIFERLPLSERTLLKRRSKYSFTITNDTGEPCLWRIIADGTELGAVKYHNGRKLVAYAITGAEA